MDKCCVCGQTTNDLDTYMSVLTKKPKVYCFNCILSGFEPYEDLVNFGWEYGMFNQTFIRKILHPSLIREGKTVTQFNEDVRKRVSKTDATVL
jgi:hypothetical protein